MKLSIPEKILVALMMVLAVIAGSSFYIQDLKVFFPGQPAAPLVVMPVVADTLVKKYIPPQKLANPPEIIKAVYVTGWSAGSKKYLDYLSNLFKTTQINAVVVDIKDYSGTISYKDGAIPDIDALIKFLHSQNIYVIGRIVVFEDPAFAKARPDLAVYNKTLWQAAPSEPRPLWQDNKGLSWMDPASKEVWDYNISLAKDVLYHGFDEINFDYVRFPTDGDKNSMGFPIWGGLPGQGTTSKADIIKSFFQYVRTNLPGEKISVDLFGLTTVSTDDMGIGQVIENAFENFDYISPMVYPSHFANGFMGFANPADHPYDVIKYSMDTALARENTSLESTTSPSTATDLQTVSPAAPLAKFRPWLQDFNMGADYTPDMVDQEIKAVEDSLGSKYNGFMLWNPSNIYNYTY